MPLPRAVPCLPIALLLCAAAPAPAFAAAGGPEAAAAEALEAGRIGDALSLLDALLREQPESPRAILLLGRAHHAQQRDEEAAAAFRRAAELAGPSTPLGLDARCLLADALARMGRSGEALEVLKAVQAAAPDRPAVRHDLGAIHLALGELEEAARAYQAEIDLGGRAAGDGGGSGSVASSYQGLGVAAYRMGDDARALAALARAASTAEARYHQGLAHARAGRPGDAADSFRAALAIEPDHRGALQNLARAAGALGRGDERARALARFQELYRQDEEQRARRIRSRSLRAEAETKAAAGDLAGAAALLEQASRAEPLDPQVRLEWGRLLHGAGRLDRAEEALREAVRLDPLGAEARYRLARVLSQRGDDAAAAEQMQEACRLAPMAATYRILLAQLRLKAGRAQDAVRELRLAKRLSPSDPDSSFNLGLALAQAGALREAAAELEAAVGLGHSDPRVHQVLSQIYSRLGDAERSRREQETYLRLTSPGETGP
ncbi:MAG TPA: tetratricopeptide repeat protein [Candidatus Polarisedimenticolia bacterium]|nr:tetratricopeptide repeat protein [Candidatus Polarisedimenticolia bacterium]